MPAAEGQVYLLKALHTDEDSGASLLQWRLSTPAIGDVQWYDRSWPLAPTSRRQVPNCSDGTRPCESQSALDLNCRHRGLIACGTLRQPPARLLTHEHELPRSDGSRPLMQGRQAKNQDRKQPSGREQQPPITREPTPLVPQPRIALAADRCATRMKERPH